MSDQIIDYMLMSGNAYFSTRSDVNRVPNPNGWSLLPDESLRRRGPLASGFEAAAYQQGNQIVISYAGTYPGRTSTAMLPEDIMADGTLGYGVCHHQLKEAALYYMQGKAANTGAVCQQ